MRKFDSIRDFINYAPKCLFCDKPLVVFIAFNDKIRAAKMGKITLNSGLSAAALYRGVIEKSPLNASYNYKSRIDEDKLIIRCTENYYSKNENKSYDVININLDTSEIVLSSEVEVGVLNSFAKLNFKLLATCANTICSGHSYSSTKIIAGAKSKKIMSFFLRDEWMSTEVSGFTYCLKSDYYSISSYLEKSSLSSDYNNFYVGLSSDSPTITLPMIDLFFIKNKESFEYKVENYSTFS